MVAPAPLTAWWHTAGVVVSGIALVVVLVLAGQAAPGMRVDLQMAYRVEAAVALEIQGMQHTV